MNRPQPDISERHVLKGHRTFCGEQQKINEWYFKTPEEALKCDSLLIKPCRNCMYQINKRVT